MTITPQANAVKPMVNRLDDEKFMKLSELIEMCNAPDSLTRLTAKRRLKEHAMTVLPELVKAASGVLRNPTDLMPLVKMKAALAHAEEVRLKP
jgi:hypothetical protein